jgi:hypothetical protein
VLQWGPDEETERYDLFRIERIGGTPFDAINVGNIRQTEGNEDFSDSCGSDQGSSDGNTGPDPRVLFSLSQPSPPQDSLQFYRLSPPDSEGFHRLERLGDIFSGGDPPSPGGMCKIIEIKCAQHMPSS